MTFVITTDGTITQSPKIPFTQLPDGGEPLQLFRIVGLVRYDCPFGHVHV